MPSYGRLSPPPRYASTIHGAVNRVSVGVNNFGEMLSNSLNTVARPIQPIRNLNIGIRGPPGRSLEPRHILFPYREVGCGAVGIPPGDSLS